MDLNTLLLVLDGKDDQQAYEYGLQEYQKTYLSGNTRGEISLYEAGQAVFYEDRFEHAFKTSKDRVRHPYAKDKVARDRIERLHWIKAILQGEVEETECWLVLSKDRGNCQDRLYIVWSQSYVIRLTPTRNPDVWKFITAYVARRQDIERYVKGGTKLWTIPKQKEMPRD